MVAFSRGHSANSHSPRTASHKPSNFVLSEGQPAANGGADVAVKVLRGYGIQWVHRTGGR